MAMLSIKNKQKNIGLKGSGTKSAILFNFLTAWHRGEREEKEREGGKGRWWFAVYRRKKLPMVADGRCAKPLTGTPHCGKPNGLHPGQWAFLWHFC